ncbi:MAG: M14 family zinc carboxypeptidase, partial [Shewanella sp.]
RLSIEATGHSHQHRQQLSLIITSAANQANLAQIKQQRQQVKPTGEQDKLVLWLAYSIHGDEASGAHTAMALSYYLSHSQEPWVQELLNDAVIIITPSQNPDGMDRFATWANDNKGQQAVNHPDDREHNQVWHGGRFNHYLADLNRDWLAVSHPETAGRLALFHRWMPHLVADFHEMGHHQSYFFQPGVPERTHPLTSANNQTLTNQLAQFHRQALDKRDQPYFSRESFDDFYYGKGSTYPDINGAIGILFEQASARGQRQHSSDGEVSLTIAIGNHFATSISSLQGALALKKSLLNHQQDFYQGKKFQPQASYAGRLVGTQSDSSRLQALGKLLTQHHIHWRYLTQTIELNKIQFTPETSIFIPEAQPQASLVNALFDKTTEFKDATFYDVSSWDISAAFNLDVAATSLTDKQLSATAPASKPVSLTAGAALIIEWHSHASAQLLVQLQQLGIKVRASNQAFTLSTNAGDVAFSAGSLIIFQAQPLMDKAELLAQVQELSARYSLPVYSSTSFASIKGIDLGSENIAAIASVTPLIISGQGTNPSEVGEWWLYLDKQLGLTAQRIDIDKLNNNSQINLSDFSHIILADGRYQELKADVTTKLQTFVAQGGVLIANQGALSWLKSKNLTRANLISHEQLASQFNSLGLSYSEQAKLAAKKSIGGAIVTLELDNSHPLNFGIQSAQIRVLKNQVLAIEPGIEPFLSAATYSDDLLSSGYLAPEYQQSFAGMTALHVEQQGQGALVLLTDNLLFRNTWPQNEKIIDNALFMVPTFMTK